jgi:raffinose/stachyose/melibiose transport system permease protein
VSAPAIQRTTQQATQQPGRRPTQRTRTTRRLVKKVPTTILVAILLVIVVYPLVWLLLGSFKTNAEFLNNPTWSLPSEFSFDNYVEAWNTGNIAQYATNSVLFGTAAGFALEVLVWKGRGGVLLAFLIGIMVPTQMILLPLFTVYFQTGLTGTLWPLVITYTAIGLPLTVFMMATYFRAIPREVFEAATLDGASIIRTFFSVGMPMVSNAIFTVALVQFFFIWNDLLIALTFTNSNALRTIQVGLLNFQGEYGQVQWGPLFAAISINVFGTLVLYLFLNQRVMKGLAGGALKG